MYVKNRLVNTEYRDPVTRVLHREDGPAVILSTGTEMWLQHGRKHRIDGPALVRPDGYQAWYQNDVRHNAYGPAIITQDQLVMFYLEGKSVTFSEWLRITKAPASVEMEILLKYKIRDA